MIKAMVAIREGYIRDAQLYFGSEEEEDHRFVSDDWADIAGEIIVAKFTVETEQQLQDRVDAVANMYDIPVNRLILYRMWQIT